MAIIGTLPNNIQNGQVVDANPVMADFNFIVNQVNANGQSIAGLATAMLLSPSKGSLINIQAFGTSGTYTPTVNATKALVLAVGGGGAGGGFTASASLLAAPGGSGGSTALLWITSGLVSAAVGIGAAGPGNTGGTGGSGGATTLAGFLTCPGGVGGTVATTANPNPIPPALSNLPTAIAGTLLLPLQGGAATYGSITPSVQVIGGNGGGGIWGTGGAPGASNSAGVNASVSGAGGSGASFNSPGGPGIGGSGAAGGMLIFEFA
jgi:hypothetical protein